MIKVSQYDYVRIAQRVYGKNIKEIARETGHSKNTIKNILKNQYTGYKHREHQPHPVLEQYIPIIDSWLEQDKAQHKKQRHTAVRIYNRLKQEHGYCGGESTVRYYVHTAKVRLGMVKSQAVIPLDPLIGIEAEIDWGTVLAVIDGQTMTLKLFCMRSKYSGKHFVRCYPCERQQAFFDAHMQGFEFFGGIFQVLIYDNLTTAVKKVLHGKNRKLQETYMQFQAYYSFSPRFCNPGQGREKGGVEGLVGYARRNYMVPVPEAETLDALNEKLLLDCLAYGEHRTAGKEKKVHEYFEEEKKHLLALPSDRFSNILTLSSKPDKYSTVIVDNNRYSVPTDYFGCQMNVELSVDGVDIFYNKKLIASHQRVYGANKWCLEPLHYLKLIQQRPQSFDSARPIRQWRALWPECLEKLLERFRDKQGHSHGTKDFIGVLMLYRQYEGNDILTAVELALESKVSTSEGVKNIMLYLTKQSDNTFDSLDIWEALPEPDVSIYGQLGGQI
jgi:transposase